MWSTSLVEHLRLSQLKLQTTLLRLGKYLGSIYLDSVHLGMASPLHIVTPIILCKIRYQLQLKLAELPLIWTPHGRTCGLKLNNIDNLNTSGITFTSSFGEFLLLQISWSLHSDFAPFVTVYMDASPYQSQAKQAFFLSCISKVFGFSLMLMHPSGECYLTCNWWNYSKREIMQGSSLTYWNSVTSNLHCSKKERAIELLENARKP